MSEELKKERKKRVDKPLPKNPSALDWEIISEGDCEVLTTSLKVVSFKGEARLWRHKDSKELVVEPLVVSN